MEPHIGEELKEKVVYYPAVMFADLKKFKQVLSKEPYADLLDGDVSRYIEYKNSVVGLDQKQNPIKNNETGRLEIK